VVGDRLIAAVPVERAGAEPAFLARIRVRAQRRALWLRQLWASGRTDGDRDLAISHGEVDRVLADPAWLAEVEASFFAEDPLARELDGIVAEADAAAAADPAWSLLRGELGIPSPDADLLSLAVAAELRPELLRTYGYLQDDVAARAPSPALAEVLFDWPAGAALAAGDSLVEWALARRAEPGEDGSTSSGWVADTQLVGWLAGNASAVPMPPGAQLIRSHDLPRTCLYPAALEAMQELVVAAWRHGRPPLELELVGPRGGGRGVLAAQLAAALGAGLVAADASILAGPDAARQATRVVRAARLAGAFVYWRGADAVDPEVWSKVRGRVALQLFGVGEPQHREPAPGTVAASHPLPALRRAARRSLWGELSSLPVPTPVSDFQLTPAEIGAAADIAALSPAAADDACRRQVEARPGELLTPLPCPYEWDDIVLHPHLAAHLREFEQHARLRWEVYEEWGFERLVPLGRGLTALFAGPSGTGKTMAAQVLARSLELDLYRIDLAGVVNKYIGETEKRLKQVFDACERSGAILFFDEADALFGRRTQVKDAHDRYANIEIDYLLQRMERFEGVAMLATNRKEDLDPAFLRRLRFVVDFLRPGPQERLAIWRLALAEQTPSGEPLLGDIDFEALSEHLPLTGAGIKSAALAAAFLARGESRLIEMRDVLAAAKRELAKHGAELRAGELGA
jgi:AAA+ superfamily predicted ATPase